MLQRVKSATQGFLGLFGYRLVDQRTAPGSSTPIELNSEDIELVHWVHDEKLSMVSLAGLCSTLSAAKYVVENEIDGDFVECGVWRGGNSIIAAEVFRRYSTQKRVFLFDTFKGMTEPTQHDRYVDNNQPALKDYIKLQRETHNDWCFAPIDEVRDNFRRRNLLDQNVVFVEGPVEKTLLQTDLLPPRISFLRLDTDWYESTKVELEVLYPSLTKGGVLVVDDYGYWSGSKKATDEYFSIKMPRPLFHATDDTRRIGVKF